MLEDARDEILHAGASNMLHSPYCALPLRDFNASHTLTLSPHQCDTNLKAGRETKNEEGMGTGTEGGTSNVWDRPLWLLQVDAGDGHQLSLQFVQRHTEENLTPKSACEIVEGGASRAISVRDGGGGTSGAISTRDGGGGTSRPAFCVHSVQIVKAQRQHSWASSHGEILSPQEEHGARAVPAAAGASLMCASGHRSNISVPRSATSSTKLQRRCSVAGLITYLHVS